MTLTEKVAKMDDSKFESWMKRNGYTGMAAVALATKRKAARYENQHTRNCVAIAESLPKSEPFNYNAPVNPFFAGAERPRCGEDY